MGGPGRCFGYSPCYALMGNPDPPSQVRNAHTRCNSLQDEARQQSGIAAPPAGSALFQVPPSKRIGPVSSPRTIKSAQHSAPRNMLPRTRDKHIESHWQTTLISNLSIYLAGHSALFPEQTHRPGGFPLLRPHLGGPQPDTIPVPAYTRCSCTDF